MKRQTLTYIRAWRTIITLLLLFLLPFVKTLAQDNDDFDEPIGRNTQQPMGEGGFDNEDMMPSLNLRRYTDEIVSIVVLAIIIAVVRGLVRREHRAGCTFFIIVFAILWYIYDRFVY